MYYLELLSMLAVLTSLQFTAVYLLKVHERVDKLYHARQQQLQAHVQPIK